MYVDCSDGFPVISSLRLVESILCLKQFSIKLNGNENGKNQSFILFSYVMVKHSRKIFVQKVGSYMRCPRNNPISIEVEKLKEIRTQFR